MNAPRYPSLYQINTRTWLTRLSADLGRLATLDDIPDAALEEFRERGFDWIWLLSVWQTGTAAQEVSRANPEWRHEFQQTLPDLTEQDIGGSGFAITGYTVAESLGGDAALARFRKRLRDRGLKLMLDFVPNHMAPDHPWVIEHPEYFVTGNEIDLIREPQNYFYVALPEGRRLFAHGRDPYFPGWPDTVQLNYGEPALQQALIGELTRIAGQCDGVRCDMAMLIEPDVFQRTWGIEIPPFWPDAIRQVRVVHPGFVFMAEVYWDREWSLQQQGFDYCYDKRLYDRLVGGSAEAVRGHFCAGLDYQDHLARFLENHDEPRAAATFDTLRHQAAAVLTFLSPGLRFFHQGQFEGCRKRISPHLIRAPHEPVDETLNAFYARLLDVLKSPVVRDGDWQLLETRPAWDGNESYRSLIAMFWQRPGSDPLLVVVNLADHASQGRVSLPLAIAGAVRLQEQIRTEVYERQGEELSAQGLYLDLLPWHSHVLTVTA